MIDSGVEIQDRDAASSPMSKRPSMRRSLHATLEAQNRRRKLFRYALGAGVAVLIVNAVIGENGYLATLRARRQLEVLASEVAKLEADNEQLRELGKRLKDDPAALEDAARRELGLVRQGETLVIVRDGKPAGK